MSTNKFYPITAFEYEKPAWLEFIGFMNMAHMLAIMKWPLKVAKTISSSKHVTPITKLFPMGELQALTYY